MDQYKRKDKDRWQIADLIQLRKGFRPKRPVPTPDEASLMRAGIGYVFHGDLVTLARSNMERYRKELPRKIRDMMKEDDWQVAIGSWNFHHYIFQLGRPYWKLQRGQVLPTSLSLLLKGAPNFVQAFGSVDDPLCNPETLQRVSKELGSPRMVLMPNGGHLGYTGTKWVRTLIHKYFKPG